MIEQTEELRRSNKELGEFAYVASHDLQEPLRMVSSYVELLRRRYGGKLDAEADQFIDFAVDGASRMQRLIHDLLAYALVGARERPLVETDCHGPYETAVSNLKAGIEESGATLTCDKLPRVKGDQTQLVQLFQNLIGNALKFMRDARPAIHVGARLDAGEWVFSVSDNGIGIDEKYMARIFTIFRRLHHRDEYPGTGIGLPICQKIVERHGGRIWATSEPGKGSTFFFTLPAMST